ncbi:hypothetical protein K443DRAFT_322434 [Laccaria amethystina LaAM-08-1]|uniref:Uncharacterized protein n=1 Tax=Laccaria amethystina LaAM-08-1 TaxID=1095629 RepID=A0A0C9XHJ8_9AGAR|nr:hypothetical protein K443DRAFT_322434 [Laccaria amethystina LaAM-08-1]
MSLQLPPNGTAQPNIHPLPYFTLEPALVPPAVQVLPYATYGIGMGPKTRKSTRGDRPLQGLGYSWNEQLSVWQQVMSPFIIWNNMLALRTVPFCGVPPRLSHYRCSKSRTMRRNSSPNWTHTIRRRDWWDPRKALTIFILEHGRVRSWLSSTDSPFIPATKTPSKLYRLPAL